MKRLLEVMFVAMLLGACTLLEPGRSTEEKQAVATLTDLRTRPTLALSGLCDIFTRYKQAGIVQKFALEDPVRRLPLFETSVGEL